MAAECCDRCSLQTAACVQPWAQVSAATVCRFLTGWQPCLQVQVASDFDISYFPNYKVVRNYSTNNTHVLYPCGGEQPSAVLFEGVPNVRYFQVPLTAVAVADSTAAYFLVRSPPPPAACFRTAIVLLVPLVVPAVPLARVRIAF